LLIKGRWVCQPSCYKADYETKDFRMGGPLQSSKMREKKPCLQGAIVRQWKKKVETGRGD